MAKDAKRQEAILDNGYREVRAMAKLMVENGAALSDVLFHADQVWHEFKVGAINGGCTGVGATGMYLDQRDNARTDAIILADGSYKTMGQMLAELSSDRRKTLPRSALALALVACAGIGFLVGQAFPRHHYQLIGVHIRLDASTGKTCDLRPPAPWSSDPQKVTTPSELPYCGDQ